MSELSAPARLPLNVLQVGGLAGPGALAGGVWAVARMQSAALARLGATVELVGGWYGIPPAARPESCEKIFRVRRPYRGARLKLPIGVGMVRYVWNQGRQADIVQLHLCRDFITTLSAVLLGRAAVPVIAGARHACGPRFAQSAPIRLAHFQPGNQGAAVVADLN